MLQKQKENVCALMMKQDFEQLRPSDVNEFSEDDDDFDFLIDMCLNDGPVKCKVNGFSDAKLHERAGEREIELLEREREIEASCAALRKIDATRDDLTKKLTDTVATHGKALADFSVTQIIEKAGRGESSPPKLGNPSVMAQTGANTKHHAHDEIEWFLANMRRSFSYINLGEPPLEAR